MIRVLVNVVVMTTAHAKQGSMTYPLVNVVALPILFSGTDRMMNVPTSVVGRFPAYAMTMTKPNVPVRMTA